MVDSEKSRLRKSESLLGSAAKDSERKTRLQRKIDATDRQINQLVYELYGLMKDDIQIIEEMT
jgi:predicted  nucleic acid-binding Zn-ribbon protein